MSLYYSQHVPCDKLLDEMTVVRGPGGYERSFYGAGRDQRAQQHAADMNRIAEGDAMRRVQAAADHLIQGAMQA